ncbi:ArsR/SmtB family transcription factor [Psychrobacter sp. LV10R520-6]|uniref:ArsR/SmtB family transcription factor n=1 Tax=Psychrobacter sp. LV10R520-6 TaxID=1415574 RepID=UPI0024C8F90C|nr:metalloregulator ArsR/SmtB family transcription factor [Psychrobacter sp. LV10R520-6]SNT70626.1 DNA-binding transcriptional regulator, ArsR family [Psychrobacter sp. LV10R520-6]
MLNAKMTVVNTSTPIVTTVAALYLYKEPTLKTSTRSTHHTDNNANSNVGHSTDKLDSNTPDFAPIDLAKQMQEASLQASKLLKSLSHPDRLILLCQLTQGEYCVGELETLVGVGQPSLSQQLGILRKDQLVTTRREGKQIYYSIASDDALAVLQLLYQRFCAKTE